VERVKLGTTGLSISRLGMGCWAAGGHGWGVVRDEDSIAAIRRAFDLGINFFDTADIYGLGHSEELLAEALGTRRHEAVIATKFGLRWNAQRQVADKDVSPTHLRRALEASLQRLRLDCIPLYYAHWPDGRTPSADMMAALMRCKDEGKIRGIGLSNFSATEVREALTVGRVDALQFEFSLLEQSPLAELQSLLAHSPITLVTWGSLARGLLTGKYDTNSRFGPDDTRGRDRHFQGETYRRNLALVDDLRGLAARRGVTLAQLALRWVLDSPGVGCALFGAKTAAQVEANVGALDWRLTAADCAEIQRLSLASGRL
jgi:myo-inositol catabolism protein IolS